MSKVYHLVVDNNVIASATISEKGNAARILDAWREGKIDIIISKPIIDELRRVLFYERVRKYSFMSEREIDELIDDLEAAGIKTPAKLKLEVIKVDAADDRFIVAALEGEADYIVSGDKHLKSLGSYKGIEIVTPSKFVEILERKKEQRC